MPQWKFTRCVCNACIMNEDSFKKHVTLTNHIIDIYKMSSQFLSANFYKTYIYSFALYSIDVEVSSISCPVYYLREFFWDVTQDMVYLGTSEFYFIRAYAWYVHNMYRLPQRLVWSRYKQQSFLHFFKTKKNRELWHKTGYTYMYIYIMLLDNILYFVFYTIRYFIFCVVYIYFTAVFSNQKMFQFVLYLM